MGCIQPVFRVGGFYFCSLCFSFSPNVPIYNGFGEAPLSPELASRKAWILTSWEKWVLAVIHRKAEQFTELLLISVKLLSCPAVSHLVLLGVNTHRKISEIYLFLFPNRQSIKWEECLTLSMMVHHISHSHKMQWKDLKLLLSLLLLLLLDQRHGMVTEASCQKIPDSGLESLSSQPERALRELAYGWTYLVGLE